MAKLPGPDLRGEAGIPAAAAAMTPARCAGTLFVLLLAAAPLLAEEGPQASASTAGAARPAASSEVPEAHPAPTGWRIYRDPATGELLSAPLPGQSESLTAKWERRRPRNRPDLRTFPIILDGRTIGRGVKLDDRFVTSTVLIRNANGSDTLTCVDGAEIPKIPPAPAVAER